MGERRGPNPKRQKVLHTSTLTAEQEQQQTSGTAHGQQYDLTQLPQELLLLIVGHLAPRECHGLRQSCKAMRNLLDPNTATTLTITNSMAQYLLLAEQQHYRSGYTTTLATGWVCKLLLKFPNVTQLDVKCTQPVLTIFAKHLVRDCSHPHAAISMEKVFQLADNVRTNSRRHSAVLLCELLKLKVAESVPPPRQAGVDRIMYGKAEQQQLLNDYRLEAPPKVLELVDRVLVLKGHADARAHEHYKYARDTLDDSLLQVVSCLQPRHSKFAYQLLAKAADPTKAARGWRWLFYFLARQKQAEYAIEAYKVVDKQALLALSPTCLSELFRALIDNEISTQPESKLRAITSESGSWTKFLYRGNFSLNSVQSREGALEKVVADLITKDYLDTAVNVMNRFESDHTAAEVWLQILGALGIGAAGEMPLACRDLHKSVTEQLERAKKLLSQVALARRTAGYAPLIELLVAEGRCDEAVDMCRTFGEQGVLDKYLLRALLTHFALADMVPEDYSAETCALLLDLLVNERNKLRDVAARAELTGLLVKAYAARGELQLAVQLASGLDAPMLAAASAAAAEAAAGPEAVAPPAAAPAAGGAAAGAAAGGGAPHAAPTAEASEAAAQQLAAMWQSLAVTAIKRNDAPALLQILEHMEPAWVLAPVSKASEEAAGSDAGGLSNAGAAGQAEAAAADIGAAAAAAAPAGIAAVVAAMVAAAGANNAANEMDLGAAGWATGTSSRVPRGARAPLTADLMDSDEGTADGCSPGSSGPSTSACATISTFKPCCKPTLDAPAIIWQAACSLLLQEGHATELRAILLDLLQRLKAEPSAPMAPLVGDSLVLVVARARRQRMERQRQFKALLEGTAVAMVNAGQAEAAVELARMEGVPCWPLLNVALPAIAQSQAEEAMEKVVQEVLLAASKGRNSPPAAAAVVAGPSCAAAGAAAAMQADGNGAAADAAADDDDGPGDVAAAEAGPGPSHYGAGAAGGTHSVAEAAGHSPSKRPRRAASAPVEPTSSDTSSSEESGEGGDEENDVEDAQGPGEDDEDEETGEEMRTDAANAMGAASTTMDDASKWEGAPRHGLVADVVCYLLAAGRPADAVMVLQRLSENGPDGERTGGKGKAVGAAAEHGAGDGAGPSGRPARPAHGRARSARSGSKRARLHGDEGDTEIGAGGGTVSKGGLSCSGSCSRIPGPVPCALMYDEPMDNVKEGAEWHDELKALQHTLGALVKTLQRSNRSNSTGAAAPAGGAGPSTSAAAPPLGDSLADILLVCRAWPPGAERVTQADKLTRRAMAKDLDVALQASELMKDESQMGSMFMQEKKIAFTLRDLAQKCIAQGRLDDAKTCLERIQGVNFETVAESAMRDLIRAHAKAGNRVMALRLAQQYVHDPTQRMELLKVSKQAGTKAKGGRKGAPEGKSSRANSRD